MSKNVVAAMKWLKKNSESLGKKYKDLWLAISPTGVKASSKSYAKIEEETTGKGYLLVKVPKNPQVAHIY